MGLYTALGLIQEEIGGSVEGEEEPETPVYEWEGLGDLESLFDGDTPATLPATSLESSSIPLSAAVPRSCNTGT